MHPWYVTVFLFLLTIEPAAAQRYHGSVVDVFSRDSLADVHVVNIRRNTGSFTDTQGYFSMIANPGDSLRFSLVGYQSQMISVNRLPSLIAMVPDTVLLPEVRVLANRINMRRDITRTPVRLPGVPAVEKPERVKLMTWTWGKKNHSEEVLPTVGLSGSLSGPISYFMGYERKQRKYEQVQQEAEDQQSYRQVISDLEVREQLMNSFRLTDRQYDSLIVIFNQHHLTLAERVSPEEVTSTLWWFFSRALEDK